MNVNMIANSTGMQGANSFTLGLFESAKAVQSEFNSHLQANLQQISARADAMQAAGKGGNINIQV